MSYPYQLPLSTTLTSYSCQLFGKMAVSYTNGNGV
jgi:hypothetical protein